MTALTVRKATQQDVEPIIDSIVLAFSTDPLVRWMYPSAHQYLKSFPDFVSTFGSRAFNSQTIYYAENYSGAAVWFPPQIEPDTDLLIEVILQTVSQSQQDEISSLLEKTSHFHPRDPHWYLGILGVESTQQKKGYGSALIKQVLTICDRDHQIAYLESSNPANNKFYEQHGFEIIDQIQVGQSPTIFPMLRYPQ
ncbi:N-acetyltransferase [Pleurocapsa sp. PCC 7319]|uniref:GNAT family N-acetyltransferase n=1 Tax=Pleurocapsa sp. PCC 7319 TaxID=118161 RepID=UPI00034C9181|nr:GNAT family N-acetyltransferase [Pleurocapsa sp. PCC 7319]